MVGQDTAGRSKSGRPPDRKLTGRPRRSVFVVPRTGSSFVARWIVSKLASVPKASERFAFFCCSGPRSTAAILPDYSWLLAAIVACWALIFLADRGRAITIRVSSGWSSRSRCRVLSALGSDVRLPCSAPNQWFARAGKRFRAVPLSCGTSAGHLLVATVELSRFNGRFGMYWREYGLRLSAGEWVSESHRNPTGGYGAIKRPIPPDRWLSSGISVGTGQNGQPRDRRISPTHSGSCRSGVSA